MTITVSKCADEVEKLNKTLTSETNRACELVNADILFPVLKMEANNLDFNYVEIPRFNYDTNKSRFYWVSKYEAIAGGHILVYCEIDPLMTYKNELLELNVIVNRNRDFPNSRIIDKKIVPFGNSKYSSKTFGGTYCRNIRYLLTTK